MLHGALYAPEHIAGPVEVEKEVSLCSHLSFPGHDDGANDCCACRNRDDDGFHGPCRDDFWTSTTGACVLNLISSLNAYGSDVCVGVPSLEDDDDESDSDDEDELGLRRPARLPIRLVSQ